MLTKEKLTLGQNEDCFAPLREDIHCTAAVVGGGLTGVCLAYLLAEKGVDTVLLEQGTLAGGKTGRSTAKVTLAHENIYSSLTERISAEAARKYAAANKAGFAFIRRCPAGHLSDCERDFYLYALYGETRLEREYRAMQEYGIDCIRCTDTPLPFPHKAAVRLPKQLAIDPQAFVRALAEQGNFRCFTHTKALRLSDHVLQCGGYRVTADMTAYCVNYPVSLGAMAAPLKLSRKTSSAVLFRSDSGFSFPDVMAYGIDGGHGFRYVSGGRLLVSGETHRGAPMPDAEARITEAVRAFAPDAEIEAAWTNNDTYTHDGIPYAGKVGGVWTACGYGAWGMTNAAGAAVILAEQMTGGEVWYADIFSPARNFLRGGKREFSEHIGTAVSGMAKHLSSLPERKASEFLPGEGGIAADHGRKVGAYRDEDGRLYIVSLRCPHLGCSLEWNRTDSTWDCPCHGSRFSAAGDCLSNPAGHSILLEVRDGARE
ncbi:MAG: FAD-dependent oxidoreductase [Clostridia bacterium]|nr:FAD-dependent oxidoreductase [Clostridia bacterium]